MDRKASVLAGIGHLYWPGSAILAVGFNQQASSSRIRRYWVIAEVTGKMSWMPMPFSRQNERIRTDAIS